MRFLTNGLKGREPLLVDPAKAADMKALADKYAFTDVLAKLFGERPQPYVTEDGVGVVPITGLIGKGLSPMECMLGSCDINAVSKALDAMASDPAVKKVCLAIDSPGGTVTGVEELANKVRNMTKPTMAYTDGEMCSAAYWIGSAADRVVASSSSSVGSIGVYMAIPDFSKAYADAGVQMVVIKSSGSPLKGAGIEGTSLTPEQIANLQEQVDSIHADFMSSVKQTRSMAKQEAMNGAVFSGKKAAGNGLITGMADSLEEALATF
jgi:signal peptide peptidase SppA